MRFLSIVILLLLGFNAVVLPNSFQVATIILMVVVGIMSLWGSFRPTASETGYFFAALCINLLYSIVGVLNDAPQAAFVQGSLIFIFAPLFWYLIASYIFTEYSLDGVSRFLSVATPLAAGSVFLYYWLYQTFGASAVAFFNVQANLNVSSEYAGAVIHVAGSFIFLAAGLIASPGVIRNSIFRIATIIFLLLATIATGRTAAILAIVVGVVFLFLGRPGRMIVRIPLGLFFAPVFVLATAYGLNLWLGVDMEQLLSGHSAKLSDTGEDERTIQALALIDGTIDSMLLGAGHGLGVSYVRNFEFPWRYEVVYLSVFYRLGLIGGLIILLPIIWANAKFLRLVFTSRATKWDLFFGPAFFSASLASFTNPYLESFVFQWMVVIPIYYFVRRKEILRLD